MCQTFRHVPDLLNELMGLLAQVPSGRVTTYGSLADALGNRIAARWVGQVMRNHEHDAGCTCHRVVRAGGGLGFYVAGGTPVKARRLREERVEVFQDAVDLARFGFQRFESGRPLEKLRQVQNKLVSKVSLRSRTAIPRVVGGVDVSYPAADVGIAAYALVDVPTGRLMWSQTVRRRVLFPYITSYLAFRELPILLDLIDAVRQARRLAQPLLVDGSGVLHPRHAGIATHLGVAASLATIGVTKKLLCGQVDLAGLEPYESRPVAHDDQLAGVAIRPTAGSRRPIFVSPGNRIDLERAEQVVRRLLTGHRLPEPLYWADRLSRRPADSES
jgi:deoxyribonuclease V